ncbi:MAG: chemotaxis protein CheA, partial [SAR324 cluster bacterium]|nr:chemotaxis protein CheA [SAR324 cluster bacterium]
MDKPQAEGIDRLAELATRIEEGDIAGIGDLYRLVDDLGSNAGIEADCKTVRDILTRLTTAEGKQYRRLHKALQQAVREIEDQATGAGGSNRGQDVSQAPPQGEAATVPSPPPPPVVKAGPDKSEEIMDKELFLEFVEESLSHLQTIELNILSLETDPGNRTYIDNVFRPFHTIKGVSGFLDLKVINFLCHSLENLLAEARDGQMAITGPISDLVLEAVDLLKNMIETSRSADSPLDVMAGFQEEAEAFVAKIQSARAAEFKPAAPAEAETAPETAPTPDPEAPPPKILGSILVEDHAISQEQLDTAVKIQEDSEGVRLGEILVQDNLASVKSVARALRQQTESKKVPAEEAKRIASGRDTGGETVRVRISLLDQLMNLAGELVLGRNQLLQKLDGHSDEVQGLNSILQHVDRVTSEVQEAVMQTRMQPVGGLFSRFHRVVRDLARSLGKEIELSVSGEAVELDKSLIEALTDPLTHLIRNAADHGIEDPDTRKANGKSAAGHITLRANQEGGKVRVVISDDGAGVNLERVRAKALENGLINRETMQQISEKETLRLLFEPGFSTAQAVTGVSGRGVGMDVVRQNVEGIGGTIDIETRLGEGTTISLSLPLTLAIIPALIVLAGDQRFCIPQINLLELVRLEGEEAMRDLMNIRGHGVYRLRGEMLPLLPLKGVLQIAEA